jgi:hypothetical protein
MAVPSFLGSPFGLTFAPPPLAGLAGARPLAQPVASLPPSSHLDEAERALSLTPEERALYLRHLNNFYGAGGVDNPNGSRSSLYQMTIMGPDGRAYVVPTVWNGRIVSDRDALRHNIETAGGLPAFPSYGSVDEAERRYQQMHDFMDRDAGDYFRSRGPAGWRE